MREHLQSNSNKSVPLPGLQDIVQLCAYDTGFVALSARGEVWTWGDERYPACLGRETTDKR